MKIQSADWKKISAKHILRPGIQNWEIGIHKYITGQLKLKTDHNKVWQEYGEIRTLIFCWREWTMVQSLWKIVWQFYEKLNICLPCDSAILFLYIYPREKEIYIHTIFIAALFVIAKTCVLPRILRSLQDSWPLVYRHLPSPRYFKRNNLGTTLKRLYRYY